MELAMAVRQHVLRPARRATRVAYSGVLGTIVGAETNGQPQVALTFDDGPGPYTPAVLETLARYDARATFFVLGRNVVSQKRLLCEIRDAGHAIGNHTFWHSSLPGSGPRGIWREIQNGRRVIEDTLGISTTLLRPPFGYQNLSSYLVARGSGHEVVCWSSSGTDWEGDSAATVAERITMTLQPGGIVLLHDGSDRPDDIAFSDRSATVAALSLVLEHLKTLGIRCVTVPELLRAGRPRRVVWFSREAET